MSLAGDVRARLIAQGVAASTTTAAWPCFIGGLTDRVNQPQMSVIETTGFAPLDVMGVGNANTIERPGFQILVRGDVNGYEAAQEKTAAIMTALHRQTFGDQMIVEATSNAAWLGYEPDTDRPMWSLNFIAHTR